MKRLIVNADDYGLTPGVTRGIREAHLKGIVTSTTAMMNFPGAEEAVRESREACPHLGLGVHLMISAGSPVLPAGQIRSLVTAEGSFWPHADQCARLAAGEDLPYEARALKAEWMAQIEKFSMAAGRLPDHLDSHHHASYWTPMMLNTMLELAEEYYCPIRCFPQHVFSEMSPAMGKRLFEAVPLLLAGHAVPHPMQTIVEFFDGTGTQAATFEKLDEIIATLPEGVSELMCHPGHVDAELQAKSTYRQSRERELAILTHPGVQEKLRAKGIELVTFRALMDARS